MKFLSIATAALVAAATVSAAPAKVDRRDAITTVAKGICFLEAGLGVTSTEDFLDTEVGGAISDLESKLGITALEDAAGLTSCESETSGKSDALLLTTGLCYVEKGTGITAGEDALDSLLGGLVSGLEGLLGVTQFEKAVGLSGC